MRYAEINQMFTYVVTDYLIDGWTINTTTMSGSQGEVAKVDFTDGKRIARVALEKKYDSEMCVDYYAITASVTNDDCNVVPNKMRSNTLWNRDLVEVSVQRFYRASIMSDVDWFVSREEALENNSKWRDRQLQKLHAMQDKDITFKAAGIVLGYVRRQKGCKTAKKNDIKVSKSSGHYVIRYKAHKWVLR